MMAAEAEAAMHKILRGACMLMTKQQDEPRLSLLRERLQVA